MLSSEVIYSRVLKESIDAFSQWRLTITEFRGVQYLNIREYFLSCEGTWEPTKSGISVPLELVFTNELLLGLKEILSDAS